MALPYATKQELKQSLEVLGEDKQDKIVVTPEDVGKLVGVNEEGKLALVDAPSGGGTKLYKHSIAAGNNYPNQYFTYDYISTNSTPLTKAQISILSRIDEVNFIKCPNALQTMSLTSSNVEISEIKIQALTYIEGGPDAEKIKKSIVTIDSNGFTASASVVCTANDVINAAYVTDTVTEL